MKRFHLYEQVFTSDPMEYIGHMTFDKGDLVPDMEVNATPKNCFTFRV